MNRWKQNSSPWYSLGLGILLCIAVLVISTGTAYARYRTERTKDITFSVREPEQIVLGAFHTITQDEATEEQPEGTVIFQPQKKLEWNTVDGISSLTMTIANGTSDADCAKRDQQLQLRLIGTNGLWTGMEPVKMYLMIPSEEDPAKTESLQAVPVAIEEGTALYYNHGPGWVFTFQGEDGELTWELSGGQFSTIELTITMEGVTPQETASLQTQITSRVA